MNTDSASGSPTPAKRRLRAVEVVAVDHQNERLVTIDFAGDLDDFAIASPTQHVKILFPEAAAHSVEMPDMGPNGPEFSTAPTIRTYTPRRFDAASGVLQVQFVVHGEGPASIWAARAQVGDRLALGGPGGRFPFDLKHQKWVLAGDESAQPAIGTVLDALPDYAETRVISATTSTELESALRDTSIAPDANVWIAGEASSVRRIRADLLTRGVLASRLVTRGYWRVGTANHPDHDYGED
jgi:NADPH-dependent ferric siderophore reductase